jgi:small subunit ribosomal protein S1
MQSALRDRVESPAKWNDVGEDQTDSKPFARLLDTYKPEQPKRGQLLRGRILQIEPDAIIMDVGAKCDAIVPREEMAKLAEEDWDNIQCGAQLPVYVLKTLRVGERLTVSIVRGYELRDWDQARLSLSTGEVHKLDVIGLNRGGVVARFGRLRGFIPNSHIPGLRRNASHEEQKELKQKRIGTQVQVKVIDVDQRKHRLILSGRAVEQAKRQRLLQELVAGQVVEGVVVHIVDFGVFVNIGGADGLVHISELAHHRLNHPSEVVELGDVLDVQVLNVDVNRERISLSRKALMPGPWDSVEERYAVGDLVEGVITNIRDFGAFIVLPDGIEGLIHKSEIGILVLGHPGDVVKSEERVIARILHIDPQHKRMSLSLRRVTYDEQVTWMEKKTG